MDIEALPQACDGIDVPPVDPTQVAELSAWLATPTTVIGTTFEEYLCAAPDFDMFALDCPCIGWLRLIQLDFAMEPGPVGAYPVDLLDGSASCGDTCDAEVYGQVDFGVQILAETETCFVVETVDWPYPVRFFVDRTAACAG